MTRHIKSMARKVVELVANYVQLQFYSLIGGMVIVLGRMWFKK